MVKSLRVTAKILLTAVAIAALVWGMVEALIYSPFFRYPTGGEYPPPAINELIWPTIGYPAMVLPGGAVEVEVDLGGKSMSETSPGAATGWAAAITPSREELSGSSYQLAVLDWWIAPSSRWPSGTREGNGEDVWHVRFETPQGVPPDLYDIRVDAATEEGLISDEQPHAMAVTADDDDDFRFITLADIHVHGRNNSTAFRHQSDKGIAPDGEPEFLEEAIAQVNLIKPDFVLMLGDYIRGQRRPGDVESEYALFYRALLDLEVPVFLLPGNHDQYVNEIDGGRFYEQNIGPLYYSFDIGDCHFTCLNSCQWPEDDRVVMDKLFYREPRKWQGQVLGAEESDPSTYTGQLAWLEDDLSSSKSAPLRVMAMHHDPYSPSGEAYSYRNISGYGLIIPAGGGEGREALLELASAYDVHAVFGGHLHEDFMGAVPWERGNGETTYSCQTCVTYGPGGLEAKYPGYRLVEVDDGAITGLAYLDGVHSFPFYDGSVPGGETDLDHLDRPALQLESAESGGGGEWELDFTVSNYLAVDMELSGLSVAVPASPTGGYVVTGGEVYGQVAIPGRPDRVLLLVRTEVGAGTPGPAADVPGVPEVKRVTVRAF